MSNLEKRIEIIGRKSSLPLNLMLGPFLGKQANDQFLGPVETCVKGAWDYFSRTEPGRSARRIAADRLAEALADADRLLYVLEDSKGQKAGLLELAMNTPQRREITIVLLVLGQKWRGWGWGREVMSSLNLILRKAGIEHLRLGVAEDEKEAADFWLALGFWQAGEEDGVRLFELPLVSPSTFTKNERAKECP